MANTQIPEVTITPSKKTGVLGRMVPTLSGLIGAGGSFLSSIIAGQQQRQNIADQLKANKELANYQFSQNRQMWDLQNRYNSPEAQMERFKSAGLNPNLIYGQGSPGNAQTAPRYESPSVDYSNVQARLNPSDMLDKFMDWNMKSATFNNVLANNAVINESARTKKIQNDVAEQWAMELAKEKVNLLQSQSYATHEQGRYSQTRNRIATETMQGLIDQINNTNRMIEKRNQEELTRYQFDAKLREQQFNTNQIYLNFMKNPKLDWATFVQLWKTFSSGALQGAGLMIK